MSIKKFLHDESSTDDDSPKELLDDFGLHEWDVALDMLNIFSITFYQPSITVFEILAKNVKEIESGTYKESSDDSGLNVSNVVLDM